MLQVLTPNQRHTPVHAPLLDLSDMDVYPTRSLAARVKTLKVVTPSHRRDGLQRSGRWQTITSFRHETVAVGAVSENLKLAHRARGTQRSCYPLAKKCYVETKLKHEASQPLLVVCPAVL